ncbi:hypothetical protein [uncultured Dokdonia sp.]|uniref:hypothetical protein n=1 Tax=uncultured Dokdonia sp. TaxID=575653 RepID=UPI0030ED4608
MRHIKKLAHLILKAHYYNYLQSIIIIFYAFAKAYLYYHIKRAISCLGDVLSSARGYNF